MSKAWPLLPVIAALAAAASPALAEPPSPPAPRAFTSLMAAPTLCLPGSQVACQCGGGGRGLAIGIERLRATRNDPLGIVMIATGGVAMTAGIPITIVGIVFLATRGLHPDQSGMQWTPEGLTLTPSPGATFTLTPTASGLALQF